MAPQVITEVPATDRETRAAATEKKRESSRDIISSMEKRVTKSEEAMGDVQEALEEAEPRLKKLGSLKDKVKEEAQGIIDGWYETLNKRADTVQEAMDAMKAELVGEIKNLISELLLYKNVMVSDMVGEAVAPKLRIDVPKPKEFKGARAAQEVDNFIWGLE
ncbi:hypothetical protein HRI_000072600 [Hibiscus trionum]|uniref:Uncharacterized protein n=1 Tax=Hibiscus trionum TaxID=183268 RepID=A0A9W7GRK8_HIBTR|nr:hypothetical protein HRI_000072600 [Hibiscus trionum]